MPSHNQEGRDRGNNDDRGQGEPNPYSNAESTRLRIKRIGNAIDGRDFGHPTARAKTTALRYPGLTPGAGRRRTAVNIVLRMRAHVLNLLARRYLRERHT